MIIISAGLQKSGSTLIANLEEALLLNSGKRNGQKRVRERFNGRYFQKLNYKLTAILVLYNLFYGSFVIKTHTKPDIFVRFLIRSRLAKATYSFRDPRDVVLSAIDHGNRSRAGLDPKMSFINFVSVEQSIPITVELLKTWKKWEDFAKVFFIRYESFMEDPFTALKEVCNYLKLRVDDKKIRDLIDEQEKIKYSSHNFNKGITYRYKNELSKEQLELCNNGFKKYLVGMRYGHEE